MVTLGQVVMAFRVRDGGDKGAALASADERFQLGMVAVESCRRFALALGRPEQDANVEACDVKDKLKDLDDANWWAYEFELIGAWMEFLHHYLDAVE